MDEGKYKEDAFDLSEVATLVEARLPPCIILQAFKYFAEGEVMVSLKSRALPSVADSFFVPMLSLLNGVLNWPKV